MGFELWDTRSRNLVDWFDTEEQALSFVREVLQHDDGRSMVHDWLLDEVHVSGRSVVVARGTDLVQRAIVQLA